MTASLTPNRQAVLSALYFLYEGSTFLAILANTSGAASPPALGGTLTSWFTPTNYLLSSDYDIFLTGGFVAYDATITSRAKLPQLVITLDYASSVTYTDVLIVCLPVVDETKVTLVGVIHESSPITLLSTQSKTYNVDLFAEWI